jgi:GAF domain-containing protein
MLKDDALIGTITIYRQEVLPFSDKQIGLVRNFAAQAVIAIENARLLHELRQRTADLSESLEQQTATSEVLRVISSSPGDLEPVFQAMLENAVRICEARFGVLTLTEADALHVVAMHNAPPEYAEFRRREPVFRSPKDKGMHRMVAQAAATKEPVQVADIMQDLTNRDDPQAARFVALTGARTIIFVPMFKDDETIGVINIYRQEVRPFTEKQIDLLQNFAAQAVIAIENARLLNELRQRTDDLTESLQQQTATAEVLGVISESPGELKPVFDTVLENATRLCEANFGTLYRFENGAFWVTALRNAPPEFAAFQQGGPRRPSPASTLGRAAKSRNQPMWSISGPSRATSKAIPMSWRPPE